MAMQTPSTHGTTVLDQLLSSLHAYYTHLGHDLDGQATKPPTLTIPLEAPLARHMRRLYDAAHRGIPSSSATRDDVDAVRRSLDAVLDIAWTPPAVTTRTVPPQHWWLHTPLGRLCGAAMRWLYDGDLVNYTDAAAILYPSEPTAGREAQRRMVQRIARLVADGDLVPFADDAETNPKHAQRVLSGQVIALRESLMAGLAHKDHDQQVAMGRQLKETL